MAIGKGRMTPRAGEAERRMEERIKKIGERDRERRGVESDLVVRHDPSIIRKGKK